MKIISAFISLFMIIQLSAGCTARFDEHEPTTFIVQKKATLTGTSYTVQVPTCNSYDLNPQQPVQLDCYVESARQQSLLHPEKAHRYLKKQE